jgi:hypothetical protein
MERGFVYLAVVLDWLRRRVLSWSVSITVPSRAARHTVESRRFPLGASCHSVKTNLVNPLLEQRHRKAFSGSTRLSLA